MSESYDKVKSKLLNDLMWINATTADETALKLINDPTIDVNYAPEYGATPFWAAAYNGKIQIVEALLNHPSIEVNRAESFWHDCSFPWS